MPSTYGRERRSSRVDSLVGWTWASISSKAGVLWYCPPGGSKADRCSTKGQLRDYWQKTGSSSKQILDLFNFKTEGVPAYWERVKVDSDGKDCEPGGGSESGNHDGGSVGRRAGSAIVGSGGSQSGSAPGPIQRLSVSSPIRQAGAGRSRYGCTEVAGGVQEARGFVGKSVSSSSASGAIAAPENTKPRAQTPSQTPGRSPSDICADKEGVEEEEEAEEPAPSQQEEDDDNDDVLNYGGTQLDCSPTAAAPGHRESIATMTMAMVTAGCEVLAGEGINSRGGGTVEVGHDGRSAGEGSAGVVDHVFNGPAEGPETEERGNSHESDEERQEDQEDREDQEDQEDQEDVNEDVNEDEDDDGVVGGLTQLDTLEVPRESILWCVPRAGRAGGSANGDAASTPSRGADDGESASIAGGDTAKPLVQDAKGRDDRREGRGLTCAVRGPSPLDDKQDDDSSNETEEDDEQEALTQIDDDATAVAAALATETAKVAVPTASGGAAGLGRHSRDGEGESDAAGISAPAVDRPEDSGDNSSDPSDRESVSDPNELFDRLEVADEQQTGESDDREEGGGGGEEEGEQQEEEREGDSVHVLSPPKPRVTRKKSKENPSLMLPQGSDAWDYLETVKGWECAQGVQGWKLAAPREGSKPMDMHQLPEYLATHKDELRECINWVEQRKEEAEKAVEEGEDSEEGEEGSEEGEGGIEEGEGARQDGEEGDVDEELMPTKRLRSARNLRLPDPNRVWKFLKREEKWRYFGKGWQVVPPDGSSPPMDEVHLPSYLSDHSGLLKKFTAWERDSEMLVRRVAHAPQPLRAEDEEGPDEDEQDAQEEGNREEGGQRQEDEEEESGKDAERLFIFLTKTRGWKIVPQEGDVMRICAMKGSTPVEEADLPQYVKTIPRLLADFKKWNRSDGPVHERGQGCDEEEINEEEEEEEEEAVQNKKEGRGGEGEQEGEEHERPTKRQLRERPGRGKQPRAGGGTTQLDHRSPSLSSRSRRHSGPPDPDLLSYKDAGAFVGLKGWGYSDSDHRVAPEEGAEPVHHRALAEYILAHPELKAESKRWKDKEEEKWAKEKAAKAAKRLEEQIKRNEEKQRQARERQRKAEAKKKQEQAKQARLPKQKTGRGGGGGGGNAARGRKGKQQAKTTRPRQKRGASVPASRKNVGPAAAAAAAAGFGRAGKRGAGGARRKNVGDNDGEEEDEEEEEEEGEEEEEYESDESSSEEEDEAEEEEEEEDTDGEDSEMDEDERKSILMHQFKIKDLGMSHVWRFLKDCEGWTWRNGGKLDGPFLYFHRDAPDLAFPNQEELIAVVDSDPRLRKDCFAYYFEKNPRVLKPTKKTTPKNRGGAGHGGGKSNGDVRGASTTVQERQAEAEGDEEEEEDEKEEEESEEEDEAEEEEEEKEEEEEVQDAAIFNSSGNGNGKATNRKKRVSFTTTATRAAAATPAAGRKGPSSTSGKSGGGGGGGGRKKSSRTTTSSPQELEHEREHGEEVDDVTDFIDPPVIPDSGNVGEVCRVCLGPGGGKRGEALLMCRGHNCGTHVHKNCYPVAVKTVTGPRFMCNACDKVKKNNLRPEERGCVICRQKQGVESYAMIPTIEGCFVHYLCFKKAVPDADSKWEFDKGKYVPPAGVPEAIALSEAKAKATGKSSKRRCNECKRAGGALKRCERQGCSTRFHPLCGAVVTAAAQMLSEGKDWKGLGVDMTIQCDAQKHKADQPCIECGGAEGEIVGCRTCQTFYHKDCHNPPIPDDVEGDRWRCGNCEGALAMRGEDGDSSGEEDEQYNGEGGDVEDIGEQQDDPTEREEEGEEEEEEEEEANWEADSPYPPGSPEHIGWMKMFKQKGRQVVSALTGRPGGKAKAKTTTPKGKGKATKAAPSTTTTTAMATPSPKTVIPKGKGKKRGAPQQQQPSGPPGTKSIKKGTQKKTAKKTRKGSKLLSKRSSRKATKGDAGGGRKKRAKAAREMREALEAMWSSGEEGGDGGGFTDTSDEEDDDLGFDSGDSGDEEGGGGYGNGNGNRNRLKKRRTEAFSAVPVGAQAYFNSQAGVGTLAVIPGGISTASSVAQGGKGGAAGKRPTVVRKRGWHTRNRYTRVAKESRLIEERAARKRARENGGAAAAANNDDDDDDDDDSDNDEGGDHGRGRWEAAGAGAGIYGGEGAGAYAKLEELLKAAQEPVRDIVDAASSKAEKRFPKWKSQMDWGWSLMFYGVGSKRELLMKFEDYVDEQNAGGAAVVGYDGFNADASVRDLLDGLCRELLADQDPEYSHGSLLHYAQGFIRAFELQRLPSFPTSSYGRSGGGGGGGGSSNGNGGVGGRAGRSTAGAGATTILGGVDYSMVAQKRTVARRLFIFLHSIDGEKLRNEDSQEALAELSASKYMHLVASMDHVNAPLMWDARLSEKFNWAYHKAHTYKPYVEEVRSRRNWCTVEGEVQALERLSQVMRALTPRHVDVVVCVAKKLKENPDLQGKCNYRDVLAKLKSNLSADTSQVLDGLLVELKDHNVIVEEKNGNTRLLSITGGAEVLDFLAGYQR